MKPKSRLGRGIDAIFPETSISDENAQIVELAAEEIINNPAQPRKEFDEKKIAELAGSISENGLIQPIIVRRIGSKYEIIAGERRYRASREAGLERIPAIIRELPDDEAFKISLIENLQREDLNPMEEAEAYHTLRKQFKLTHQEIAQSISKDRSTISNMLRLMGLPEDVKAALRSGSVTMGHARAILMLEDYNDQLLLLNKIIKSGLSVRETEKLASKGFEKQPRKSKRDPVAEKMALELSEKLSAKVECSFGKNSGKIVIEVKSRAEMQQIVEKISGGGSPL